MSEPLPPNRMGYQIVVEFPSEEMANEWCAQMSDGFGENFCDFSFFWQKPGTDGLSMDHYERVQEAGRNVYFVKKIFDKD